MIIPVDYAQANLKFSGAPLPTGAEITLGLDVNGYAGNPAAAAGDVIAAWLASGIRDRQADTVELSSVLVKFGPNATGPSAEVSDPVPGTQAADAVHPNTAMLVRKSTGAGGRTGSGRFFIPGIPENAIGDNGVLSAPFLLAAQTEMDAFHAALLAEGLIPALLHGAGSPISAPLPITSFDVQPLVATQRRRLRR